MSIHLRATSVDLTRCSSWLKFYEVHEENRTTVAFLCGGGVQAFEVRPLHFAAADSVLWFETDDIPGSALGLRYGMKQKFSRVARFVGWRSLIGYAKSSRYAVKIAYL